MNQFDAAELQAWRFLHFDLGMHVTFDSVPGLPPCWLRVHDANGNYTTHPMTADRSASLVHAALYHAQLAGVRFSVGA